MRSWQKRDAGDQPRLHADPRMAVNAWTVGLAGGLLEGAPIRLAAGMARAVDDGPNLHVLPIVTRRATVNVNSLLYLRGVDTAIINSDALEEYRLKIPQIRNRITYLLNLFRAAYLRAPRNHILAGFDKKRTSIPWAPLPPIRAI